ncbi:transcription factor MYB36 [Sorghum bicolor]|uniref:Uncharacterized protein n=3 Tax=Sorghum bicolor TaxID=4558 RepID=C5XU90_SORBI|nr:transcription factor MYB36 [Sorghum bicolor]EES05913.2 hypothetical protein SORBI_3004G322800 [Sorghum bicolor]|eukprot:XP_021314448.1 transcription factor MYB36 [Sorghum bicolor]
MGRAPCCDKASVKKGPWSPEEDAKLKAYIEEHGTGGNWIALPQKIGLKRCGKSCRLRWLNYLRPNIKHGDFTEEEEHIICSLYISIGSRWSIIAAQLPGRTDNDIKNYWNTKLKKKLLGKRAPSRRARANQDPYLAAGAGNMCSTSGGVNNNSAAAATSTQALSASALERIQLHMRLQGIYGAFGCSADANDDSNAAAVAAAPQWPKLEALLQANRLLPGSLPADAMATTVSVQQHHQHLVDHQSLAAGASDAAAVEGEQQLSSAGGAANYMAPGGFFERPKLGFYSPSAEAEAPAGGGVEMNSGAPMVGGGYGGAGFGAHHQHDELYDFLYSKYGSVGELAHDGHVPTLPELQCPDGAAVVGADEKFSAWTASACDYGAAGGHQIQQGNSIMHDYVLGGYDQ